MALGIAAIVMICAGGFGSVISIVTIFHQLLFSRDHKINAELHKRALEQQQTSLAQIRLELSKTKLHEIPLYEDGKLALSSIEERLDVIYQQKYDLIEKHINFIDKNIVSNNLNGSSVAMAGFNNYFKLQLEILDQRLKSLLSKREQLLKNQFTIIKSMQSSELERSKQLNNLYETHSKMISELQHDFSKQQITLSELFIKSSASLIESAIIAPVRFIGAYFSSTSQTNNERTDKEKLDREKIFLLEKQLNIGERAVNSLVV